MSTARHPQTWRNTMRAQEDELVRQLLHSDDLDAVLHAIDEQHFRTLLPTLATHTAFDPSPNPVLTSPAPSLAPNGEHDHETVANARRASHDTTAAFRGPSMGTSLLLSPAPPSTLSAVGPHERRRSQLPPPPPSPHTRTELDAAIHHNVLDLVPPHDPLRSLDSGLTDVAQNRIALQLHVLRQQRELAVLCSRAGLPAEELLEGTGFGQLAREQATQLAPLVSPTGGSVTVNNHYYFNKDGAGESPRATSPSPRRLSEPHSPSSPPAIADPVGTIQPVTNSTTTQRTARRSPRRRTHLRHGALPHTPTATTEEASDAASDAEDDFEGDLLDLDDTEALPPPPRIIERAQHRRVNPSSDRGDHTGAAPESSRDRSESSSVAASSPTSKHVTDVALNGGGGAAIRVLSGRESLVADAARCGRPSLPPPPPPSPPNNISSPRETKPEPATPERPPAVTATRASRGDGAASSDLDTPRNPQLRTSRPVTKGTQEGRSHSSARASTTRRRGHGSHRRRRRTRRNADVESYADYLEVRPRDGRAGVVHASSSSYSYTSSSLTPPPGHTSRRPHEPSRRRFSPALPHTFLTQLTPLQTTMMSVRSGPRGTTDAVRYRPPSPQPMTPPPQHHHHTDPRRTATKHAVYDTTPTRPPLSHNRPTAHPTDAQASVTRLSKGVLYGSMLPRSAPVRPGPAYTTDAPSRAVRNATTSAAMPRVLGGAVPHPARGADVHGGSVASSVVSGAVLHATETHTPNYESIPSQSHYETVVVEPRPHHTRPQRTEPVRVTAPRPQSSQHSSNRYAVVGSSSHSTVEPLVWMSSSSGCVAGPNGYIRDLHNSRRGRHAGAANASSNANVSADAPTTAAPRGSSVLIGAAVDPRRQPRGQAVVSASRAASMSCTERFGIAPLAA